MKSICCQFPPLMLFLKTLEEPPAYAIFILATTEIHKIPQTIISRCQRFDFRKVALAEVVDRLSRIVTAEKRKVDKEVLATIARRGEGTVRDAESLLGQILSLGEKEITLEQVQLFIPSSSFSLIFELVYYLAKKNIAQSIALINRLVQEGVDLQKFTDDLVEVLRKILLVKISGQLNEFTTALDKEFESQISKIAKNFSLADLTKMIDLFIAARLELKSADIIQLPLEMAVIAICVEIDSDEHSGRGTDANIGLEEKSMPTAAVNRNFEAVESVSAPKTVEPAVSAIKPENKESVLVKTVQSETKHVGKIKLNLDQVKERWDEVLACLKKYNQVLASTLHLHRPTAVKEGGIIEISFKYKFYQQRISEAKNLKILEDVLEQVFSMPLRIEMVIVKDLPRPEIKKVADENLTPQQSSVDSLLQSFGGQLVE